jgi:Mn2+/Fe2+ NRAMP family transporter
VCSHTCFLGRLFHIIVIYNSINLTFQENNKAKFLCICMSGFILLSIVLGALISQAEISLSMNGMLTKLSGESVYALMSLLGANIMPHNFFLHSSIVQVSLPSILLLLCNYPHCFFFASAYVCKCPMCVCISASI